jgi:SAM-dependent methyltransferase
MSTNHHPLYDTIGRGYARLRRPDPRIERVIVEALGDCRRVVNVGAGTGSYEPRDREVVAVEPSSEMIAQRATDAAPVVQASAESLPFDDDSFDAAMAVLTVHHWSDRAAGLREMKRVARDRVVILTCDPSFDDFWLTRDYVPEVAEIDRVIMPSLDELRAALGTIDVRTVMIPHDCVDGFLGAYWRRPERYLDPDVRAAISSFARVPAIDARMDALRRDLETGVWHERNAGILALDEIDVGYRLVTT